VLHHPKWPKCKFLHLHQNRSKLIKTGRNRSKQIVNDDMIYKKIKKEKRKCIFRTTREFICLNLFRPHSVFFPPKKILPYLCYVFPPLKSNISPFFPCPIFFSPLIFTVLKLRSIISTQKILRIRHCKFFFQELMDSSKKEKKGKGKTENRKQRKHDNVI